MYKQMWLTTCEQTPPLKVGVYCDVNQIFIRVFC